LNILVTGSGGFIGHHLVRHLREQGHKVRGVDIKHPEFSKDESDEFILGDLRDVNVCRQAVRDIDRVFHLAADMGGIGWISTHHAEILSNSLLIDLNMLRAAHEAKVDRLLFSSSACVYPEYNQTEPDAAPLKEAEVYPALPEAAYGWGKLTTEKLCEHYQKDYGLETRTTRFHNVYGPEETWDGGREKAPAALSRKIAIAKLEGKHEIEVWGDGIQRRSFVYVSDVVSGLIALMDSEYSGAVNIGNDYTVSINELAEKLSSIADWPVSLKHVDGAQGVRGRNSDNTLARSVLPAWRPLVGLDQGLSVTYRWVEEQVVASRRSERPAYSSIADLDWHDQHGRRTVSVG
jgi:GDP-D-mannose 3',5'-epimerase